MFMSWKSKKGRKGVVQKKLFEEIMHENFINAMKGMNLKIRKGWGSKKQCGPKDLHIQIHHNQTSGKPRKKIIIETMTQMSHVSISR